MYVCVCVCILYQGFVFWTRFLSPILVAQKSPKGCPKVVQKPSISPKVAGNWPRDINMGMVTKVVPVRAAELSIGAFCAEFWCERFCDDDVFWDWVLEIRVGRSTIGVGKLTTVCHSRLAVCRLFWAKKKCSVSFHSVQKGDPFIVRSLPFPNCLLPSKPFRPRSKSGRFRNKYSGPSPRWFPWAPVTS